MHLFTYGTLMFPEVWQAVVGREFQTLPAHLPNYQIFRVKDAVYPGIVKSSSQPSALSHQLPNSSPGSQPSTLDPRLCTVPGVLYLDLDPASLDRLDAFEDDFYRRQTVTVFCKDITCDGGRELAAEAYIVPPESAHVLTDEIWTAEEFQARSHLAEFVSRYSGFNRLS